MDVLYGYFVWDSDKEKANTLKHGVNFRTASGAFMDENRVIIEDLEHSQAEDRFYCIGKVDDDILTVWFAYRDLLIRIIGAGKLKKGQDIYENKK